MQDNIIINQIIEKSKQLHKQFPCLRYGQCIFNVTDELTGFARAIQFDEKIDCFYDDSQVDAFLNKLKEYLERKN